MRIAGLDPGKQRDSFAFVAIDCSNDKIKILGAKRWLHRNYIEVEDNLAKIHAEKPFDYYVVEINNTGNHVYEVLRIQKNLPVIPVTTTKDIKDPDKKYSMKLMDKNEMVRNMMHWFQDGTIQFPLQSNKELDELKRQLSIFAEHKSESGSVSYRAEGQEHDDLVMALMLACWYGYRADGYVVEARDAGKTPIENRPKSGLIFKSEGS